MPLQASLNSTLCRCVWERRRSSRPVNCRANHQRGSKLRHIHADTVMRIRVPSLFVPPVLRSMSFQPCGDYDHKATQFAWKLIVLRKKNAIRRPLIWLDAQLPKALRCIYLSTKQGPSSLFILLVGTIQTTLWFKGIDGWLKGLEMRMEMRRIIWVSRVSSVPVLGERIEGRQHCKVVYFVYVCVCARGTM